MCIEVRRKKGHSVYKSATNKLEKGRKLKKFAKLPLVKEVNGSFSN